jgi:protein-disulfide isomerase
VKTFMLLASRCCKQRRYFRPSEPVADRPLQASATKSYNSAMKSFVLAAALAFTALPCVAQTAFPPTGATSFRDTSLFKPPAGAKVAIIEFEDLECYACGQASPIVHAAMEKYNIPRVHHDYLIPSHIWSRTAAIQARYLEDKLSPKIAETYRRDVFSNQSLIASRDDLQQFTARWFKTHNLQMPFVFDGSGSCEKQVDADCLLARHIGVAHTPTIIVATADRWIEVTDPRQLFTVVDMARASLVPSHR